MSSEKLHQPERKKVEHDSCDQARRPVFRKLSDPQIHGKPTQPKRYKDKRVVCQWHGEKRKWQIEQRQRQTIACKPLGLIFCCKLERVCKPVYMSERGVF